METTTVTQDNVVLKNETPPKLDVKENRDPSVKTERTSTDPPQNAAEVEGTNSGLESSTAAATVNGEPSSGAASLNSSASSDEHEFECTSCQQKFVGEVTFYSHLEAKPPCWEQDSAPEGRVLIKSARCRWCDRSFPSVEDCYAHLENNECSVRTELAEEEDVSRDGTEGDDDGEGEESDNEKYRCSLCNIGFKTTTEMRLHAIETHSGEDRRVKVQEVAAEDEEQEDDDDQDGWVGEGYEHEHGSGDEDEENEEGDEVNEDVQDGGEEIEENPAGDEDGEESDEEIEQVHESDEENEDVEDAAEDVEDAAEDVEDAAEELEEGDEEIEVGEEEPVMKEEAATDQAEEGEVCPMCPVTFTNDFLLECHVISEHKVTSTARVRMLIHASRNKRKERGKKTEDGQVRCNTHKDPINCYDFATGVFKCSICQGTFSTALLLCKHLLAEHSVFFSSQCRFCGLGSSQDAKIAEHEKVCGDKPPGTKIEPIEQNKPAPRPKTEAAKQTVVASKPKLAPPKRKFDPPKKKMDAWKPAVELKRTPATQPGLVTKKPKTKAELRALMAASLLAKNKGSGERSLETSRPSSRRSTSTRSSSTPEKLKKPVIFPSRKPAVPPASSRASSPADEPGEDGDEAKEERTDAPRIKATLNRATGTFSCDLCGKETRMMSRMRSHFRIHTGERPYKCRLCHRAFAHSSNRSTHEKMHKVNKDIENTKIFRCADCPATFQSFPALCEHSRVHSTTIRSNAMDTGIKMSAAVAAKKHILKRAIRGKVEFNASRAKLAKKSGNAHYCTICSHPKMFAQAMSLRVHMEQFHRVKFDRGLLYGKTRDSSSSEFDEDEEVNKNIKIEAVVKSHLPVPERNGEARPIVRRRRKVYECSRCQEKFYDEYSHTQHMLAHKRSEDATCRLCKPAKEFKGESAYWRHLRSTHGVTAAGRLHPVKMHPAGRDVQETLIKDVGDEDVEVDVEELDEEMDVEEEGDERADEMEAEQEVEESDDEEEDGEGQELPAASLVLEDDLEEEEVDVEEVQKFWHEQLSPTGTSQQAFVEDQKPVQDSKPKQGLVAAKHPRSIFQRRSSPARDDGKKKQREEKEAASGAKHGEDNGGKRGGLKIDLAAAQASFTEKLLKNGRFLQSEKRWRCNACDKPLAGRVKFIAHASCHSDDQLFMCPKCTQSFEKMESLEDHFETHEFEVKRGYRCKICLKAFTSSRWKESVINHMKGHFGGEVFVCKECPQTEYFANMEELQVHVNDAHVVENDDGEESSEWDDGEEMLDDEVVEDEEEARNQEEELRSEQAEEEEVQNEEWHNDNRVPDEEEIQDEDDLNSDEEVEVKSEAEVHYEEEEATDEEEALDEEKLHETEEDQYEEEQQDEEQKELEQDEEENEEQEEEAQPMEEVQGEERQDDGEEQDEEVQDQDEVQREEGQYDEEEDDYEDEIDDEVPVAGTSGPNLAQNDSLDNFPQCQHCEARFVNELSLDMHIQHAHPPAVKRRRFKSAVVSTIQPQQVFGPTVAGSEAECDLCKKLFAHQEGLDDHVKKEHTEGSRKAKSLPQSQAARGPSDYSLAEQTCPYCRAHFESHKQLAGHFLQHSWNRPPGLQKSDKRYPCKFCPEVFRALCFLVVHVNDFHPDAPVGIFDFQCDECGEYFINPLKLSLHKTKIHDAPRPDNPMGKKSMLSLKRKSFPIPKASSAPSTPAKFSKKSAAPKVEGDDLDCQICGESFGTPRGLKSHITRRHGKRGRADESSSDEMSDYDEETEMPPAKRAKLSPEPASEYDVVYCKRCNVAYGGLTRKYHLNCPEKPSPPPSDAAGPSTSNGTSARSVPRGSLAKEEKAEEHDKCPDCNLSYAFETPEKHVNNCPLGPRRVVVSPRGLKTYKNQSVYVSAMDRSQTMDMLAAGAKQFRVIEVSSKRFRKPSLKMLDVYDTQASLRVESANKKWLCTPRNQNRANYTSVETQTNDSDFDNEEDASVFPTGDYCSKCGEKFSGRLSRIDHDKKCPGLSPFLRAVKDKPDPLAASTSEVAGGVEHERQTSLQDVVVKDEFFLFSDDEAVANSVQETPVC